MYEVNYYINNRRYRWDYIFSTLWGASYKATCIFEEHGFPVDIVDNTTGEVLVVLDSVGVYIAPTVEKKNICSRLENFSQINP